MRAPAASAARVPRLETERCPGGAASVVPVRACSTGAARVPRLETERCPGGAASVVPVRACSTGAARFKGEFGGGGGE